MSKRSTTNIPLNCSLCPKTPSFSDISHLLTHISSKSHLSHRFKLQIRSQGEPEARQILDNFETWYAENGLEDLLSDRLAIKEHKKATKKPRVSAGAIKEEQTAVKIEQKPILHAQGFRAPYPPMYSWSTGPPTHPQFQQPRACQWTDNSSYATPTSERYLPNFTQHQSPSHSSTAALETIPAKLDDSEIDKDLDNSKLKGVYWPGMDLFDSATTEMRRMRNQKKDGSILEQMKLSSAEVEPTEWVFNANGEVYKIRPIFGNSSDSSPVKSEMDPTPKRRRKGKALLTDINVNAPLLQTELNESPKRLNLKRKTTIKNQALAPKPSTKDLTSFQRFGDDHFSTTADEDEEFRLTVQEMGGKKPFGIFRDAEAPSPGRTESPLEDATFDFPHHNLALQPLSTNMSLLVSPPIPVFKPIPLRAPEPENLNRSTGISESLLSANGFPPQYFHDQAFNPLLYSPHGHGWSYEQQPKAQSVSKLPQSSVNRDFKRAPSHGVRQSGFGNTGQSPELGNNMQFRM